MLRKSLTWAAENDVVIDFQKVDAGIIIVVRRGGIRSGICLVDNTGKIADCAYDFVQELLHPVIDAIRLEHLRNPEEHQENQENQENHV